MKIGIRELAEKAKKEGAYDLAQGVIDAPLPRVLAKALQSVPLTEVSKYNNKRGVQAYREAIQRYLSTRGWMVDIESVLATSGAMGAITSALLADCSPGATVLLPEPFFVYHKLLFETLGYNVKFFPTKLGEPLDWTSLEQAMEGTSAVVLTSPSNPTGQTASPEVLARLAEKSLEVDCLLVVDEMYREFIWNEEKPDDSEYANINLDKTVIVRSFSKTFAIPGWRVGFAITSHDRMERMATTHDALYIGGSTPAQHAVAKALSDNLDDLVQYVVNLRQQLIANKEMLEAAFAAYGMDALPVPATYYMLLAHHMDHDVTAMEVLLERKIVTTPANILFSNTEKDTGYIRIHFAVDPKTALDVSSILTGKVA